ncbi:MAG: hypothetical protein JEZ04_00075 [Spirochaetales bacterium]|nr:hypothetical protein [Spirochaetales bacterium]
MKKIFTGTFISVLLFFPVLTLFSFGWPVGDPIVTATFGEDKWGTFGHGIGISGSSIEVYPSEKGEIVFYYENSEVFSQMPSGLGSFAVVEHERKLRTLYGGLDLSPELENSEKITTEDSLGKAGLTGKSDKMHLFFAVIDSEFGQFVNPLLLLNSIADSKAPVIREVGIRSPAGYQLIGREAVVSAGRAEIQAEIFDPCMSEDFSRPMAPYKIYLFLNGEEIFYISFESMITEASEAVVQSNASLLYSDYYKEDGRISLGDINLVPGEFRFEILVSDYAGNETSRAFKIRVVE